MLSPANYFTTLTRILGYGRLISMAKLKNPMFSLGAVGRLAKHLSLTRRRKVDIIEATPILKDAKTNAQLSWRHMYQKAVALWHALSATEKQEWESLARPKHMAGFAWFMSQALKPNPGLYLPLQGGTMAGIIDMAKHRIKKLPAPIANQDPVTRKYFEDNLPVGGYTEGARVYHNAPQTIPHATWTTLAFNSERWDTNVIHDLVTNNSRLTCKTPGTYAIQGQIYWEGNATGRRYHRFLLNQTTIIAMTNWFAAGLGDIVYEIYTQYELALNDFVELVVLQESGGALPVNSTAQFSPEFMMQRIG